MPDQDRLARAGLRVVHARSAVGRCGDKLLAVGAESNVEDLVIVASQRVDALPSLDIPDLACPVNRPRDAKLPAKVKLRARDLAPVARQRVDALPREHIPHLCGVVEGTSYDLTTIRIEIK